MDTLRFDLLAKALAHAGTRRCVLRLLAALPLAGVATLFGKESDAARRHHRTLRHHRDKQRGQVQEQRKHKKHKKKRKTPSSLVSPSPTCAQTCAGCCTGESCQTGNNEAACGANGAPCAVCSGVQWTCQSGACQCDVCDHGCAYDSVQAAVADAAGPTTIRICAGTYHEDVTIDRHLTLIGAGDGDGPGDTILKGTGNGSVITVNPQLNVTLQALRITGGNAPGGGIYTTLLDTVTLRHCTVSGNMASVGGGIFIRGTLTLDASHVTANEAAQGGGIYCQFTNPNSVVTLQNGSTVTKNTANTGGGISSASCQLTLLSGSSVNGNTAKLLDSGGVANTGTLTLIASEIANNTAATVGGGVYNGVGAQVTLLDGSRITGNEASPTEGSGGGMYNKGTVHPEGGTISGNSPDQCVDDGGTGCPPSP